MSLDNSLHCVSYASEVGTHNPVYPDLSYEQPSGVGFLWVTVSLCVVLRLERPVVQWWISV